MREYPAKKAGSRRSKSNINTAAYFSALSVIYPGCTGILTGDIPQQEIPDPAGMSHFAGKISVDSPKDIIYT